MTTHRWPNIAVMGAGALGCYFGGMLARASAPVTLIGRQNHVDAINRNGLLFESAGRTDSIPVPATADPSAIRDARVVLFCVKSSDTAATAEQIAPYVAKDAVILSLQNGVENIERIRARLINPVVAACVYTAATMPAPGHVHHTGGGNLVIGGADQALLDEIASLFKRADVTVTISPDIDAELWTKLLMNSAYNAVSALTVSPYGEMVAVPEIRAIMRAAAEEVIAVATAKGITIGPGILDTMFDLAKVMPKTMSSTAQDIAKGRPTEIDYLNGTVVREGERLGIAVPVNRVLSALTRLREKSAGKTG